MLTTKRGGIVYNKNTDFNEEVMRQCYHLSTFFAFDSFEKALCFLDKIVRVGCYGDASTSTEKRKVWIKRICSNNCYNRGGKTSKVGCNAHAFAREVQIRTLLRGPTFRNEQIIINSNNHIYSTQQCEVLPKFESKSIEGKYRVVMKKTMVLVTVASCHSDACKQLMLSNSFHLKYKKNKPYQPQPVDVNFHSFIDPFNSNNHFNQPLQSPFVLCNQPLLQSNPTKNDDQNRADNAICAFTQCVLNYDGPICVLNSEAAEISKKYVSKIDELLEMLELDTTKHPNDQRLSSLLQSLKLSKKSFVE
ncbi:Uncharacterized protein QTN25_009064 [Entamoeba marina]